MDFHIVATILTINIHIDRGIDHCVIHRGVEESLLVLSTFDIYGSKFLLPLSGSFPTNLVEGLSLCLSL